MNEIQADNLKDWAETARGHVLAVILSLTSGITHLNSGDFYPLFIYWGQRDDNPSEEPKRLHYANYNEGISANSMH